MIQGRRSLPFFKLAILLIPLSALGAKSSSAQSSKPIVREERSIVIDSKTETWRLEWRMQPEPYCDTGDAAWLTCPCSGFAFGECGELDLVRLVPGKSEEKVSLTQYFSKGRAILPRWPELESDVDLEDSSNFGQIIRSRPIVAIMNFADYDHDGRATEFPIQIGAGPCGHRSTILVGVSRNNPHLHVFGTIAHPDRPLVLEHPTDWTQLLASGGNTTVAQWACGDHASEEHIEVQLHATANGIEAIRLFYSCDENSTARRLLKREEL